MPNNLSNSGGVPTSVLELPLYPLNDVSEFVVAQEFFHPVVDAKRKNAELAPGSTAVASELTTLCEQASATTDSDAIVILKKDSSYHVHFYPYTVSGAGYFQSYLVDFINWLRSLNKEDTVYFYQCDFFGYMPWMAAPLIAIRDCKATTVFMLDAMIEEGYFALACKEIRVFDTGALVLRRDIPNDSMEYEKSYTSFSKALFARAVERKIITQEELESIFNRDAVLFFTAEELRKRMIA